MPHHLAEPPRPAPAPVEPEVPAATARAGGTAMRQQVLPEETTLYPSVRIPLVRSSVPHTVVRIHQSVGQH